PPAQPGPRERGLDQILSQAPVAGQQPGAPQQRPLPLVNEPGEILAVSIHLVSGLARWHHPMDSATQAKGSCAIRWPEQHLSLSGVVASRDGTTPERLRGSYSYTRQA